MVMLLVRSVLMLLARALLQRLLMMWVEGAWKADNVAGAVPTAAAAESTAVVAAAERGHMERMALLPLLVSPLLLLSLLLEQALAGER